MLYSCAVKLLSLEHFVILNNIIAMYNYNMLFVVIVDVFTLLLPFIKATAQQLFQLLL